jgi:DNA-binding Lrp family transcriptional regulator
MDSIDAGIIRELSGPEGNYPWNVREPFSQMAHKLRTDQKTIWRRIQNLERNRILEGREVVANPYFIGHQPIRMILNVANHDKTKDTIISQLIHVDGTVLILDWQGPTLHLLVFCENESAISRKIKLISSICGCEEPIVLRNSEALGFYECKLKPSTKDLLILRSLRKNPRKKVQQIAKEVHLSKRTVERRIGVLTANHAFFHMVRMGFQNVEGLTCSAFVFYSDRAKKSTGDAEIESRLQRLVFSATRGNRISQFTFVCKNAFESEEVKRWLQTIEGIENVMMGLVTKYILVTDWLDFEMEQMISSQTIRGSVR